MRVYDPEQHEALAQWGAVRCHSALQISTNINFDLGKVKAVLFHSCFAQHN